ncbi:MAG: hypothetical protein V2B14_04430 [bacterium]
MDKYFIRDENIEIGIESPKSPLYIDIKERLNNNFEKLRVEQIEPWGKLHIGHPLAVNFKSGKVVSYNGVRFEGSPQIVFWSDKYIQPFIKEIIKDTFSFVMEKMREFDITSTEPLDDTARLTKILVLKTYNAMLNIENKGISEEKIENYTKSLFDFIGKFKEAKEALLDKYLFNFDGLKLYPDRRLQYKSNEKRLEPLLFDLLKRCMDDFKKGEKVIDLSTVNELTQRKKNWRR